MNHAAKHMRRVETAEADDVRTETIYESDGSDGYCAGTWGYAVSRGGWSVPVMTSGRGGFASREHAAQAAHRVLTTE